MNSLRRQLLGAGAALLVAPGMRSVLAGTPAGGTVVRIVVADNDTAGAIRSYKTFLEALERRFGNTGTRFEPLFIPIAMETVPLQARALATTLLPFKPDIIFASNPGLAHAVVSLNTGKPIIFFSNSDPITDGLTDSLTRPSKGMTGFTLGRRASIKRREMLLRLAPSCRLMGLLGGIGGAEDHQFMDTDSRDVFPDMQTRRFHCASVAELEAVLASKPGRSVQAWDVEYTLVPYRYAEDTVQLFNRAGRPVIYPRMKHLHMGGMAAYVPKIEESDDVWASQLALLLSGVPVENIPIVQATRYSFGLNLKACRRLGVTPPKALIRIADVVVE